MTAAYGLAANDEPHPTDEQWQDLLNKIHDVKKSHGHEKTFTQLIMIMYELFPMVSEFTEWEMGREGEQMDAMSDLLSDVNIIQAQFNDSKESSDVDTHAIYKAINSTKHGGIIPILNQYGGSKDPKIAFPQSLIDDVKSQLDVLFPDGYDDDDDIGDAAEKWHKAWKESTGDQDPSKTIAPYTDALTALSTDFNSQSSKVQAEYKYDQADDQQYYGFNQTIMSNFVKLESSCNSKINQN